MTKRWFPVLAIALIAVALVSYKQLTKVPSATSTSFRQSAEKRSGLSLLLVADPREASESDGCGQIVRMVRAAGVRGIALRELSPGAAPQIDSRYRVVVSPTVLVLQDGKVLKRYQGESPETVQSVRAELQVLEDHR